MTIGEGWLDNGLLRVEWDGDGLLTSVRDIVAGRQVLADTERGNLFQLHDDHPRAFDAWDVDRTYLEQVTNLVALDSIEVLERHPLRGGVRFIRSFGASTITQTMRLAAGTRRLEFHTDVEWHERHRFLKVAFPVSVRSSARDLRDPARPSRTADRREHQLGRSALRGVRPPVGRSE